MFLLDLMNLYDKTPAKYYKTLFAFVSFAEREKKNFLFVFSLCSGITAGQI